ncbi:MAG: hypothetical protein U0793_26305 [Gemmataceae bacterium]
MERPFNQIDAEQRGDLYCVRLRHQHVDEKGLEELGAEIARLIDEKGCNKLILLLGPEEPLCLYSVFLAKLVNLQRRLRSNGGALALAELSAETEKIFQVAGLDKFFTFYPDRDTALHALGAGAA